MKAIAAEAGFDPTLVERAARMLPPAERPPALERLLGGPVRDRVEVDLPGAMNASTAEWLLTVVRAELEVQGEGEANAHGMSWASGGEGSQVLVTARPEGEGTRVRVAIDRRQTLLVTTMFSGFATVGAVIAFIAAEESGLPVANPAGLALLGGAVATIFGTARAVWASTGRRLREARASLIDVLARAVERD